MVFKLPRIPLTVRLIDAAGKATSTFQRWWQQVVDAIERQEAQQDMIILTLADASAAVAAAEAAALAAQENIPFAYPDQFDPLAVGNDATHDDGPAIQAMFTACKTDGRIASFRRGRRYYSAQTLEADPSRLIVNGNGAVLDFRLKTFVNPTTLPELVADPDMNTGTGWIASVNQTLAPTFTAGQMVFNDPPAVTQKYLEIGQQITMPANTKMQFSVTIDSLVAVTIGINTFRDIGFSFRNNNLSSAALNIGNAGNVGSGNVFISSTQITGAGTVITFTMSSSVANPYLRIQSNAASVKISKVSIKAIPDNACLRLRTVDEGQGLRGHNQRHWQDLKIAGKAGAESSLVDGIVFDTADLGYSSRVNMFNLDVSDNIARGLVFQDRAYLMNFYSCRIVCSQSSIDVLSGALDAGENIAFFGGNMGGGGPCIRNRGMGIRLYSTSLDFTSQWYVGSGACYMYGTWLETNPPTVAGKYLIDVTGGYCYVQGRIQVDGSTTPVLDAPFRVASGAFLDVDAEVPYNLHSTTGALYTGAGHFQFRGRGGSNKEMESITGLNDDANILGYGGTFEDPGIRIPAWIKGGTSDLQVDRYNVEFASSLTFTADVEPGERVLVNTSASPTSAYLNGKIRNAEAIPGTFISAYENVGSFTCDTTIGSNVVTNVSPAPTASTAINRYFWGAGLPTGSKAIAYSNGGLTITLDRAATATAVGVTINKTNTMTLSQPWNGPAATGKSILVQRSGAGTAGISVSSAQARTGTKSLRLFKTGVGSGTTCAVTIAIPVQPHRAIGGEFYWMIPPNPLLATADVYFTMSLARLYDDPGNPIPQVDGNQIFFSDQPHTAINLVTGVGWTRAGFSTTRVDLSSTHDGYTWEWTTHVLININLYSTPNGFEMFIDDVRGNLL